MRPSAVLGRAALGRALLQRQWLTERHDASATQALEHLLGLQSQAPDPPYVGLWTRLARFEPDDLGRLITERSAVRVALLRGTLHTVTARDALALRALLQPMLERTTATTFAQRLGGVLPDEIASAGAALVASGQPWTYARLTAELSERWPDASSEALGSVVRAFVPLAQVPPRGLWRTSGPAAHVPLETWIAGGASPLGPRDVAPMAVDELTTRYLTAYGPATVADLQTWCGLTRLGSRVKEMAAQGVLRSYRTAEGRTVYDVAGLEVPDPESPVPVRFLPEWDVVLLSHADRTRVISDAARAAVFTKNGIVRATLLVDGQVRATWTVTSAHGEAVLHVTELEPLDAATRAEASEEGLRLLAFGSPDARHAVRFSRP